MTKLDAALAGLRQKPRDETYELVKKGLEDLEFAASRPNFFSYDLLVDTGKNAVLLVVNTKSSEFANASVESTYLATNCNKDATAREIAETDHVKLKRVVLPPDVLEVVQKAIKLVDGSGGWPETLS